jgi:hypothetical protein
MRWRVLTALIFLIVAARADAVPLPLAPISEVSEVAPAGDEVLVSRTRGANLRVFAYPATGGAAREVFSFDAPHGLRLESAGLAASAQRAALRITMVKSVRDDIGAVQAFAGPVGGGWSELKPLTELRPPHPGFDFDVRVEGERVFTLESRGGYDDPGVVVRDPDAHEVVFATAEEARSATFAGDFVAYRSRAADESVDDRDYGDVVVVRDWRTGAVMSSADLLDDIVSIALRPDGRVAATTSDGALYEVRQGAPPRLLTRHGGSVAYAGDALLYRSGNGLRLIEASGRIRRFGAPTASLSGFATDGSRVVWEANDCLLVDDVSAPSAAAPGPGPCPRSELALASQPSARLAHTLRVVLRCVAAPLACRGVLRLATADPDTLAHAEAISRRLRFSISAGHARHVRVPLTDRGYRILRRRVARERDAIVILDARTDDGERLQPSEGVLPLATASPQVKPPKGSSPAVRRVYADYRRDGVIDVCAHSLRTLKQTLATIEPEFDTKFPDFRPAIEAGINRHAARRC